MNSTATSTAAITIHVNDQPRSLAGPTTLGALLTELGFAELKGVAVAVNDAVVPRSKWGTHPLLAADRVLVIRATQGG